jgi:tRNA(fMet)-specific endonuclease VapC
MRYMLDTNMVSFFLRGQVNVTKHVLAQPMQSLCISAITEAELLYGLAKRPEATRVYNLVHEFLRRVDVLSWSRDTAETYATTRASLEKRGRFWGPIDLLIGTHALSVDATLVTNDNAFKNIVGLRLEDWTKS